MTWPDDADGDVFRGMEESGFDFAREVEIDFCIEFDHWPLSDEETTAIACRYPGCRFIDPDAEDIQEGITLGYVQFQILDKVTYDLVTRTQEQVSKEMAQFGGSCEEWGVMLHK